MVRSTTLALTLLLATGVAHAQTTQPAIEGLLAQLQSDELPERDRAQAQLLERADQAIDALRAARRAATDPDLQLRLDTLLVRAQDRIDIGPSRLTLRFDNAPLDEVLAAVTTQAQARFSQLTGDLGAAERMPRISLDLENVSFWKALDEIETRADVMFNVQPDGWQVSRSFGQPGTRVRGSEAGAFLIQPQQSSYQRVVSYDRSRSRGNEAFSLAFMMIAEPKVKLLNGAQAVLNIDRAVDSNGNDLLDSQRSQQLGVNYGSMLNASLSLKYPKNPGETITEVSGTIRLNVARHVETLESDDLLRDGRLQRTIDDAPITLEVVPNDASQPNQIALKVSVDGARNNAAMTLIPRIQQSLQQIRVQDSRGVALRIASGPSVNSSSDGKQVVFTMGLISLQPQNATGPYSLRLEIPTRFREIDVPFTFGDLKMP